VGESGCGEFVAAQGRNSDTGRRADYQASGCLVNKVVGCWLISDSYVCSNLSTTMSSEQLAQLQKPTGEYRQYLPDLSLKRFQVMRSQDAHEYAHDFKTLRHPPWLHALYMHWLDLLQEPFKGVTTDGTSNTSDSEL
jgi:hypothetical protein